MGSSQHFALCPLLPGLRDPWESADPLWIYCRFHESRSLCYHHFLHAEYDYANNFSPAARQIRLCFSCTRSDRGRDLGGVRHPNLSRRRQHNGLEGNAFRCYLISADGRRNLLKAVEPHPGHLAISSWQKRFSHLTLVTQNIDGLHQKAGSRAVVELHGNIWRARCITCAMTIELNEYRRDACVGCGDHLRPDVVLFGEMLPPGAYELAAAAASTCELCLVVGTSALVYPAANLPSIAKAAGAYVIEVNPERTPLSPYCDEVLTGKAGDVLPQLA